MILVIILSQPAISVVRLWLRKFVATSGPGVPADAARAGIEIL